MSGRGSARLVAPFDASQFVTVNPGYMVDGEVRGVANFLEPVTGAPRRVTIYTRQVDALYSTKPAIRSAVPVDVEKALRSATRGNTIRAVDEWEYRLVNYWTLPKVITAKNGSKNLEIDGVKNIVGEVREDNHTAHLRGLLLEYSPDHFVALGVEQFDVRFVKYYYRAEPNLWEALDMAGHDIRKKEFEKLSRGKKPDIALCTIPPMSF